mgnify:CR=1 FL=1
MSTPDPTMLIICLNMILVTTDTEEHTKELIRQALFAYGMTPKEITEGELRSRGILEDRRKS